MRTTALNRAGLCEHGYANEAAASECPRCASRPAPAPPTGQMRFRMTRWHKTATTMGPVPKVLLTLVLVVPTLVFASGLRFAPTNVANVLLLIPTLAFLVLDIQLLPSIWEQGRRPPEH